MNESNNDEHGGESEDVYSSYSQNYQQKAIFYNRASKEYVRMSDGAELLTYFVKETIDPKKINILFIPGWSTGPYSWNDTWDELYQYVNLYVLETREKRFSRLKKHHKGDIDRHALDVVETMEHYKLNPKKTILMGPCFGAAVIARVVTQGYVEPLASFFMSPTKDFPFPKAMIPLAYLPSFFSYNILVKPFLKLWLLLILPRGIQRKTYFELFDNGSGFNWKRCFDLLHHMPFEDYKKVRGKVWIYASKKDRMHKGGHALEIAEHIPNSKYVEVESYYYMHHNPGSKKFVKEVMRAINEELLCDESTALNFEEITTPHYTECMKKAHVKS